MMNSPLQVVRGAVPSRLALAGHGEVRPGCAASSQFVPAVSASVPTRSFTDAAIRNSALQCGQQPVRTLSAAAEQGADPNPAGETHAAISVAVVSSGGESTGGGETTDETAATNDGAATDGGGTGAPPQEQKAKRQRVRQCVGCGQRCAPENLLRFVLGPAGEVAVDLAGRSFGRGVWCHPRSECLTKAAKHGFSRAAKRRVQLQPEQLLQDIAQAAARRSLGLIASAIGAKKAVFGGDRVALQASSLSLVVLAADAKDAAQGAGIATVAADGRLLVWGQKAQFGRLFGRSAVAVFGLQDAGIAKAVVHAIGLARLASQGSDERERSSEVR